MNTYIHTTGELEMNSDKILSIKKILPIMQKITGERISAALFDRTGKVWGVMEAKDMHMPHKEGSIVDLTTPEYAEVYKCLQTGQEMHNRLDREVFGIAMEGDILPIVEEGEVVGVVVTSYSVEKEEVIQEKADELKDNIFTVDSGVKSIGETSEELSASIKNILESSDEVGRKIQETADVIKVVATSAARSNILALNASIEAARAGEAGKGFAVVASEMGKFSKESGELAKKIDNTLKEMIELIEGMRKAVAASSEGANSQAKTVQEISSSLDAVSQQAAELAALSSNR